MINKEKIKKLECDVIVVGSGGSGSSAAQAVAESGLNVIVISKDPLASSDTKICEGVMTVREAGDENDSEEELANNIKLAGGDLPDKKITEAFAKDSKIAYDRLRENGLRPSINKIRSTPKTLAIAMGGHNRSRSVGHKNSGLSFGHVNWDTIIKFKNIEYYEDCWFLDIVKNTSDESVVGGVAYDACNGKLLSIKAKAVIIAAGGLSTLFFPKTDTMRGNTGDSYAIGIRAGAALVDMEQIQFLPFCLASPPSYEGLLAGEPATGSFLGVIRDKYNKVILDSVYLRTRAECSEAIMRAVADGRGSPNGGAFLDMTANKKAKRSGKFFMEYLKSALPTAYNNARQALGKEAGKAEVPWEVRPSAHYMMGGIKVDEYGKALSFSTKLNKIKNIKGFYAAGQAMGGLFGSNRLGSTSLTEVAVFGYRAGNDAAKHVKKNKSKIDDSYFESHHRNFFKLFNDDGKFKAYNLKLDLQRKSWKYIGAARNKKDLLAMQNYLNELDEKVKNILVKEDMSWNQQLIEKIELQNMILSAKAVTLASINRDFSLGGHVRLDGKRKKIFSKPFSTLILMEAYNKLKIEKIERERTNFKTVLKYKINELYRLYIAKFIRILPDFLKDRIIEGKYKKILGSKAKLIEIQAGSLEAAPAEINR
ncbi:MAG: Fumarate reductase flavoprotein subunit [Alphaproteobacteria bacterium MarineAlpha9_Bin4]|nr:hypothetical protein [Pelagibacterales bacterium]PPR26156.1 MAG: Fumarate reductase flavoprotein subunit [Alphaproteobacteria bacterium MarineAlpha9_Bin4]|tara:strand:- start:1849 stop:3798 length:1950 start_codon:yes stop_codon:yes gene_type:complete